MLAEVYDENPLSPSSDEDGEDEAEDQPTKKRKGRRKDEEAEYERSTRSRFAKETTESDDSHFEVSRLPIKLPSGRVQAVNGITRLPKPQTRRPKDLEVEDDVAENESNISEEDAEAESRRVAAQKGKFGRLGVAEIVGGSWTTGQKVLKAKEQIALIAAEVVAGGDLVDKVRANESSETC